MIARIILTAIGLTVGTVFVLKTEWFIKGFGRIKWAELHMGGTRTFYKALGVFIIILSFMLLTGTLQVFVLWFFTLGR